MNPFVRFRSLSWTTDPVQFSPSFTDTAQAQSSRHLPRRRNEEMYSADAVAVASIDTRWTRVHNALHPRYAAQEPLATRVHALLFSVLVLHAPQDWFTALLPTSTLVGQPSLTSIFEFSYRISQLSISSYLDISGRKQP